MINTSCTNDEANALKVLESGVNAFMTGGAGVGKSWVLNQFVASSIKRGLNVVVLAPTNIAAYDINGTTVHSFFKIGTMVQTRSIQKRIDSADNEVDDKLLNVDVLIIDEISMCRIDVFTTVAKRIFKANERRKIAGKRHIQLILSGDFFQLPPVVTDEDRIVMGVDSQTDEEMIYAFQSPYWKAFNLVNILLNEVVRQDEYEFISALNKLRVGNREGLVTIYNNCSKVVDDNAITLSGLNSEVNRINNQKLAQLPGVPTEYTAEYVDEAVEKDSIVPKHLYLKIGARVMCLAQLYDGEHNLLVRNGDMGIVTDLQDDRVLVQFDNGNHLIIMNYSWEIFKYIITEEEDTKKIVIKREKCGEIHQIPLKLAYAVTIHKSQGQTYDKANVNPSCWECGQLYVALSRVRSLQGLYLHKQPEYSDLHCSLNVIKFYNELYKNINNVVIPNNTQNTEKEQSVMNNAEDLLSVIRKW